MIKTQILYYDHTTKMYKSEPSEKDCQKTFWLLLIYRVDDNKNKTRAYLRKIQSTEKCDKYYDFLEIK